MDAAIAWIIFGLIYGFSTWLATKRNPTWWFISLVFVSGVFGILVIVIGVIVRIVKAIIMAVSKIKRKELSPEEVKARNKKMAVYVPVIFAALAGIFLVLIYVFFDMDLHLIFRNFFKTVKGFL